MSPLNVRQPEGLPCASPRGSASYRHRSLRTPTGPGCQVHDPPGLTFQAAQGQLWAHRPVGTAVPPRGGSAPTPTLTPGTAFREDVTDVWYFQKNCILKKEK